MKKILISFYLLTSISNATFAETNTPPKNIKKFTSAPILRLGDGYLNYDHIGVGESALRLDNTSVNYENMQNAINLSQTIDHEELAKNLNVDASASGGWGLFSGSASAGFMRHTENNQFRENFTFSERYFTNAVLDISNLPASTDALTPAAAGLYNKYGISEFTNRYGDKFIKELPMGAFLIVNLQLSFSTSADKEKFDGSLSGGFGSIFNASATIQRAVSSVRARGTVEVSAYQLGGDPSELPGIFAQKASGGYYITTCSLDNLQDCQGAIDGIINYAQTNFNRQIKPVGVGQKPTGNLVVVGEPELESYAGKFRIFPSPPLDPSVLEQRFELATLYRTLKTEEIFFDHFLKSAASGYFTVGANKLLKDIQFKINWNLSLFDQFNAYQCYMPGEESYCKELLNNIKQYSKPVDPKVVDYYLNTGFYEAQADMTYIPVGLPEENFVVANNNGNWVNGIMTFKLTEDKSMLETRADYVTDYHYTSTGNLVRQDIDKNYSGMLNFHNITLNTWFSIPTSIRMTNNKI